jgi:hypothetical protein
MGSRNHVMHHLGGSTIGGNLAEIFIPSDAAIGSDC